MIESEPEGSGLEGRLILSMSMSVISFITLPAAPIKAEENAIIKALIIPVFAKLPFAITVPKIPATIIIKKLPGLIILIAGISIVLPLFEVYF